MSFIAKLPEYYEETKKLSQRTWWNLNAIKKELTAEDHDCNCEYCDEKGEALYGKARDEKEAELVEVEALHGEYQATIKRIEAYAKFVGVELKESSK
jgi:hypothetical protein